MNGQDLYAPGPTFQQRPPASALPPPPPPSHRGPYTPQPQVTQQGHPSFHPQPGVSSYQHALPGFPRQGYLPQAVSCVTNSAQSYLSHTQPPHSYQSLEQQVPWSQNVHPRPPTAPLLRPSAYPLPSLQGHTLERGPPLQYPSHAHPPPLSSYSSSSRLFTSDPFRFSVPPIRPPPPPPPPPHPSPPLLPTSSPPRTPPPSEQSDVPSKNDGNHSLKDLLVGDNMTVEHPPPAKPAEDVKVYQSPCHHHTENNGPKLESMDAVVDHSPGGSDMEMEDDITHPDDETNERLSTISNCGGTSISREDYVKEQLQDLQHTEEHRVPTNALHANLLFAEASLLKDSRGGSDVASHCDFPVTKKLSSKAGELGMIKNGQTELSLKASVNESSLQHKFTSQPSVPMACEELDHGKLSGQFMEGANPFNLLQGYASDNISENEGENLLGDVSSPALRNGGSSTFDAQKGCNLGSNVRVNSLIESNTHMSAKLMVESPRNVTEADKLSLGTVIFEEKSDTCRGQESVTTSAAVQSKDHSRNYDTYIARDSKQDTKGNPAQMKVDEFGRLIREGGSESDTSDSPHYRQRHARKFRERGSSRSRSRSPRDRRRRSPQRRKRRRDRSRSLSPKRRRSRSRSPIVRRNSEFSGGKQRREKSQLPECLNFLRGKCYHGSSCRYLHPETDKREILRYNRGNEQSSFRNPGVREGKVLYDNEVKDNVLPQDVPNSREVRDAKEPTVETNHLSVYSAHDMHSGNGNSLIQGKRMSDSPVSESSSFVQASEAASAHLSVDKPDAKLGPTSQLLSIKSSIMKPFPTEDVESQSLKGLVSSVANHPSEFNLPLPPVSEVTSAPSGQDYILMPPAQFHSTPENYAPYQAPVSYQHSHFPGQSNSLPSSFLPLPPPPPPPHRMCVNVTLGERGNPSQHTEQSLQPPCDGFTSSTSTKAQPTELVDRFQTFQYQLYPLSQEHDQKLHTTKTFASSSLPVSNLSSLQSASHIMEERVTGHPVQDMDPLQSFSEAQTSSLGGGLPSDRNSSQGHPYFQQASYGLQYSGGGDGGIPAQFAQPEKVSSSMSYRTIPNFLEQNHPSNAHNLVGSRIKNHFNPYASVFDLPLSAKFKLNASTQENDTTTSTKSGAPVSSNSVPLDAQNVESVDQAPGVLPRLGGDQYDPLFDSIEPASTSFSTADHKKIDTPGNSDNVPRFGGSGRVVNEENIKQEGETGIDSLSANVSIQNEEFGETADAEVGGGLSESLTPNDANNTNAGEIEIDQVNSSRKKMKGKDSGSMKLFKKSIASFVKDVLKPSWRQGNMSKEAFKTIVKKTVDKVSVSMKGHRIPKSQPKITHYIDSSHGKLTKLVMGYVDKYVNA